MNDSRGWEGDGELVSYGLWEANLRRSLRGKAGQAALHILRDALVALPTKRLIAGALCKVADTGEPEFCAIGLYAYTKRVRAGEKPDAVIERLEGHDDDPMDTVYEGMRQGLSSTLAWYMGQKNDEEGPRDETPEQRYIRYLAWVESKLAPGPADAA